MRAMTNPGTPPTSAGLSPATDSLANGLNCPSCLRPWRWAEPISQCDHCGQTATLHGGRLPDFLSSDAPCEDLLDWPDESLKALVTWASDPGGITSAIGDELRNRAILDAQNQPTPLGARLAYHLEESRCQRTGDWLDEIIEPAGLGAGARVLDVGCGAGQTLDLLDDFQPTERVGIDVDLAALMLGLRLNDSDGRELRLVRASAHNLPFPDGHFSNVLCRVALNYMHQPTALREMARVLAPGGVLYVRVEGPGYDLDTISHSRHWRPVLGGLRGLALGVRLHLTGRQPHPRGRIIGGRSFATARSVARSLRPSGCELFQVRVRSRTLGLPFNLEILARKESA